MLQPLRQSMHWLTRIDNNKKSNTMELQAGTSLQNGRYRVERVLGQGGFGITYLGVQIYLSRKVAIKEFFMEDFCLRNSAQYVTAPTDTNKGLVDSFRRKFIKEAQNIAKLKHPNIVSIIDVFEDNGTAYYVMESLDGGSLANKVSQGALPEHVALRYIRQVASALEYIHSNNMMHLDIKPANILLDGNDNAVVIDFGLSKQYDDTGQQTSTTPVGISHGYAPIEQYNKNGVGTFSPSTDIYSLGATLYKLLTGATPPEANKIYDEGLPPLPAHITQNTRIAIETAMQPRRKDRPQSIAAFLQLLQSGTSVPSCNDVTSSPSFKEGNVGATVPHSTAGAKRSVSQPDNNVSRSNQPAENGKKSSLLWLWITLPIVLVVTVAAALFFILGSSESNNKHDEGVVLENYDVPDVPAAAYDSVIPSGKSGVKRSGNSAGIKRTKPDYGVDEPAPSKFEPKREQPVAKPNTDKTAEPVEEAPVKKKSSGMRLVPVNQGNSTSSGGSKKSPDTGGRVIRIQSK